MNRFKAVLASLITFVLCYYWGKFAGYTGFSFAWVLNFLLMTWYTYLASLFRFPLDSSWFNLKSFEKNGEIYRFAGVNLFRKLLVFTGWEKITRKDQPINKNLASLKELEYKSRSSEAGHGIIAIIVIITTFGVASSFHDALWLILLNILLNIYPILVQRYNRPRYRRVIQNFKVL